MLSTGSVSLGSRDTSRTFTDCTNLAFYYTFKFVLVLWMSLPQFGYVGLFAPQCVTILIQLSSGAQIIFRSFIQPVFSRYFSQSGSTAANLRSQADQATKPHAM